MPPWRAGIFKAFWGLSSDDSFRSVHSARGQAPALLSIGSMSPAKLSLSIVASPQSPPPFHLAKSLYLHCVTAHAQTSMTVPAADEVAAAGEPLPACDRGPHGSQLDVRRAYPVASHSRARCVDARCCSDPRRFESSAAHLPASAV